jgi:hypothetical protein
MTRSQIASHYQTIKNLRLGQSNAIGMSVRIRTVAVRFTPGGLISSGNYSMGL